MPALPARSQREAAFNKKTGRESFSGVATGFENFCCAWLLTHLLFTPAKAFPIAFWTPDATGAMTAAVIASVVHDSINCVNYRNAWN
jgi:hypothetical protein